MTGFSWFLLLTRSTGKPEAFTWTHRFELTARPAQKSKRIKSNANIHLRRVIVRLIVFTPVIYTTRNATHMSHSWFITTLHSLIMLPNSHQPFKNDTLILYRLLIRTRGARWLKNWGQLNRLRRKKGQSLRPDLDPCYHAWYCESNTHFYKV